MVEIDKTLNKLNKKITRAIKSKKRIKIKSTFRPSKVSVTIKSRKAPSVLGDPNRFFKDEMEAVKKNMFLE